MKTLFEKLSKENQKKIQNYEYHSLKNGMLNELNNKHFANELTISIAIDIFNCIYPMQLFNLNKLFELFEN